MEFVWETRKSQAKGKNEMPSESTGSQKAHEFLTPSPVPPRLVNTPAAVHPLPQRGEGKCILGFDVEFMMAENGPAWSTGSVC